MKKLFISLLVLNLLYFNVSGETYSIPLSYQMEPSYVITLPTEVDVTNNQTSFNFSVSGDIYYDHYLEVLFDDSATIYSGNISKTIYVSQDKTSFNYDEIAGTSIGKVSISHDDLKAGNYTGVLNIMISLKGE